MAFTRSPLKDKPLRNPGQSVREHRFELAYDKILAPMLMAGMFVVWTGMEWLHYFFPSSNAPWIITALAVVVVAQTAWQIVRHWPKVRMLRLAEEGEKAVGQFLDGLRESGYQVFHDVVGNDFNVDHVLIGPAGVLTIETKTWSKPASGSPKIAFDGETLRVAGREPERNPIVQAQAQAAWLRAMLEQSTGKLFAVRPVVLFPGWYVDDSRKGRKELWVLEPKALASFLAQEGQVLAPEDVKLAAFHLSRFVREQERVLEARG